MSYDINAAIAVPVNLSGALFVELRITAPLVIPIGFSGTVDVAPMYDLTGDMTIPAMTMYGEGVVECFGVAGCTIPALILDAEGIVSSEGMADIALPALAVSAQGDISEIGQADIILPPLSLDAIGTVNVVGNALLSLPRMTLAAEGRLGAVGIGNCVLPALTLQSEILQGAIGSLDQALPPLTISATGIVSIEGTADLVLPALRLSTSVTPLEYLSMALNVQNRALSLFSAYEFNSFCRFNGVHLGAKAGGIYNLDAGLTDEDQDVQWNLRTGMLALETKTAQRIVHVRLSYKSNGDLKLTAILPDGQAWEYAVTGYSESENEARVKLGKGLRGRYIMLDLSNIEGSTIALDALRLDIGQGR